jgi:hypothetical protein
MCIILDVPVDVTDWLIAGEQMRTAAILSAVGNPLMLQGSSDRQKEAPNVITANNGVQLTGMHPNGDMDFPRLNPWGEGKQIRANACICSPMGATIPTNTTSLINPLVQSSVLWVLSGVTKDSAGSPLGACRVIAFETGRMGVDGVEATVGETISDGSGNYSIPAGLNTHHQLTAYKPGSPDVAGITRNDVLPAAIG